MDTLRHGTNSMTDREVITAIGSFGRFQKTVDVTICFVCFFVSFQPFLMFFATLTPSWKCVDNSSTCDGNATRPSDDMTRCAMPRDQWYFTEQKSFSMVTWFDIPCEKQWILGTILSTYFIGFAVGAIVLGFLADKCGRRSVLLPSITMFLIFGLLTATMPDVYSTIACRFCVGFFHPGAMVQGVILMGEIVGSSHRTVATLIPFLFFPIGYCVLALKAYLLRDWRMLCIVCTIPYFVVFLCCCNFIPESPAWLQEKGRTQEAVNVLQRIAKDNKTDLPFHLILSKTSNINTSDDHAYTKSTNDMFASTLLQCILWCSTTLVFFGLNFTANQLPGDLYWNFILLSIIEIPPVIFAITACKKIGRKTTSLLPIFLAGVTCVIVAPIPKHHMGSLKIVAGIMGKFFVCIPFQSLYVWSSELFPVRCRAKGMGLMDCVSRISAACAPILANSGVDLWVVFIVLGIPALVASFVGLWLPETRTKEVLVTEQTPLQEEMTSNSEDLLSPLKGVYRYYVQTHYRDHFMSLKDMQRVSQG